MDHEEIDKNKYETRFECKKLLQLSEFSQFWINGVTIMGKDVDKN